MKHNQEQLDIINAVGKNIVVAASAGAGKTTVLISRLMKRILVDKVNVEQICAMTFTEKAASEMKKRLAKSLHETAQKEPTPFLMSQLQQLETAQISTIHSFCLSVIKEFGYLVGFDPFRVSNILSDESLKQLKQEAIESVFQSYYENQNDLFLKVAGFYSDRALDMSSFAESIFSLYDLAQIHLDSNEYLRNLSKPYLSKNFYDLPENYQTTYRFYASIMVDKYLSIIDHIRNTYHLTVEEENEKIYQEINNFEYECQQLSNIIQTGSLEEIAQQANQTFGLTISAIRGNKEFNESRNRLFDEFKNGQLDFFFYTHDFSEVNPVQLEIITLISELTIAYGNKFKALKEKARAIDFNDIEHIAYEILQYETAHKTLQERYEEVLVDEFQDSNFFQEAIVNLISRGNNAFRVGDIKQSIYGFRHAKPEIMRAHLNNPENDVYYLSNNFRSKEKIVKFNNMIFEKAMNIREFNDTYSPKDHVTIGLDRQKEPHSPIILHLPFNKQEVVVKDGIDVENGQTIQNNRLIAFMIAKDIQKQKDEGHAYQDMCVLVRNHARKKELKEAFDSFGIPYYFDAKEGFTHSYSVQDVLNVIRFCQNPMEEFYLSYLLLSGFGDYDEVMISKLRLHSPKKLVDNLQETDVSLYNQLIKLVDFFHTNSMSEALREIYRFNDYYHSKLPLSEKSNLDLLYQRLIEYTSEPHVGWQGFIDQMEFMEVDDESANAVAIDENEDVVKVLTIHQSKGLQFPIVYYLSSQRVSVQSLQKTLLMDGDYGVAFYHHHNDLKGKRNHLIRHIIGAKIQLFELEESIRLLYVALTRAQNQLHIVDTYPTKDIRDTISSHSILAKEGHTLSILRSLDPQLEQLYTVVSEEIERLPELKLDTRKIAAYPIAKVDKIPVIEEEFYAPSLDLSGGLSSTEKGLALHKILGQWPTVDFSLDFLETLELSVSAKNDLIAYRNNPLTKQHHQHNYDYEVGYAYVQEDETFVGIMDFVSINEDSVIIVDFKSDKVSDESELNERYEKQMVRYTTVAKRKYPTKRIFTYLYSLVLQKYILVQQI